MAKRRNKGPFGRDRDTDLRDVHLLIRRLEGDKDRGSTWTSHDGVEREGYLLKSFEFDRVLFYLTVLTDYLDSKLPGPKSYQTWWEAYCGEPKYRRFIEAQKRYFETHGKERGMVASALRTVAGKGDDKWNDRENLRKQVEKWSKLPLIRFEE